MPNDYGLSFAPTNANQQDQMDDPAVAPIQSAIQTLSYRMPRIQGGSPIAPPSLMQGGGSGAPGAMAPMAGPGGNLTASGGLDIEAIIRMILSGQFGQMGQMGMGAPPPALPTPNITPGYTPPGSPMVDAQGLPPKLIPPNPAPAPPQDFPFPPGMEQMPGKPPVNTHPGGPITRTPRTIGGF